MPDPLGLLRRGRGHLPTDWPLAAMFLGYPLWWILGVAPFVLLALTVVMAYQLVQRRRILAPPAFGWWLVFLVWVTVGVALLQVDAPGAVAGPNNGRYLVWAYRLLLYLAGTVVLLYVGTMRDRLTTRRVVDIMGWMFVVVTLGGLTGVLVHSVAFPSLAEIVLPKSITSNTFFYTKIHPTLAQVGDVLGYEFGRPTAPFTYANEWGLNFGVFLPFFVMSWFGPGPKWRRWVAPVFLLVAVIPVVYSLNRGLWTALIVAGVFLILRSVVAGRLTALVALLALGAVVASIVLLSPLTQTISTRLGQPNSDEGRTNLGLLGLKSVLEKSPVVGYGTTRDVQGTFKSIAQGDTASCNLCSTPALGTQGRFSLVLFGSGIGGLVALLGFLVLQFLRHIHLRSPHATGALTVLLVNLVTLPVYDLSGTALVAAMVAAAVLWREQDEAAAAHRGADVSSLHQTTLSEYLRPVRSQLAVILSLALVGMVAGGLFQHAKGTPVAATVSIWLPTEPVPKGQLGNPTTLDTEAQFISSPLVLESMQAAAGPSATVRSADLKVTASPNTRILHLTYTGSDRGAAQRAVLAAARRMLQTRGETLQARQDALIERQTRGSTALGTALQTIDTAEEAGSRTPLLERVRRGLLDGPSPLAHPSPRLPLTPGQVIREVTTRPLTDQWTVALLSGAMLGLLAGLVTAYIRAGLTRRLRGAIPPDSGLLFLGRAGPEELASDTHPLPRRLRAYGAHACLCADRDADAGKVAAVLDEYLRRVPTQGATPERVVLVATKRTRAGRVTALANELRDARVGVLGVVLAEHRSLQRADRNATALTHAPYADH